MSFKRYKSVFQESKKVNKKLSYKKESILNRFKRVLREEDLNPSDVEDIVGKIEEVITDVIGDHGVDNPVIDELSSTVKAINMQNRMTSDIDMMESKLNNKFRKLKKESMYDNSMEIEDEFSDEEMDMYDTGYDTEFESDEDEFMYDSDSIMEAEEDDEDEEMKEESEEDEDEEEMEEAYDDDEDDEEEKKESYKRKKRIAEMKRKLREAEEDEDEDEEEMEEAYDDDEDEMKEEAESDEGDNLIDYDNGSDYDYLSSIDSEGNYSSGRGMEADMDDNRE